ncbi:hypothetical protein D3C87_323850 [compost metagenome]
MSLAIKFGDNNDPNQLSGFIYFDVVTKYSKQLSGKVTSHPLDAGASITDHYISENPKYSIVGVISSADISGIPSKILIDGEAPLNVNPQTGAVIVNDSFSGLLSFIPNTSSQFLNSQPESVSVDSFQRTDYKDQINTLIEKLMTGLVYNEQEKKLRNRMTLITLYEFIEDILSIESEDLVMTNCSFEEDPDTGNGLFVTMTLEQVSFVTLQKTELPRDVSASLSKSSQSTSKKSKADGTEKTVGNPADATSTDPGPKLSRRELNELELREAQKARDALKAKK